MSAIDMKMTFLQVIISSLSLQKAAEMMSARHGKPVAFYLAALQQNPFSGFDQMVADELEKASLVKQPA